MMLAKCEPHGLAGLYLSCILSIVSHVSNKLHSPEMFGMTWTVCWPFTSVWYCSLISSYSKRLQPSDTCLCAVIVGVCIMCWDFCIVVKTYWSQSCCVWNNFPSISISKQSLWNLLNIVDENRTSQDHVSLQYQTRQNSCDNSVKTYMYVCLHKCRLPTLMIFGLLRSGTLKY